MLGLEYEYAPHWHPHTLPEAWAPSENARGVDARIRRIEDAWALHAAAATGFGASELYRDSGR